jgi:uncharacterized OB-fold protein
VSYEKPLPTIDAWNKPFWEATRKHELRLQSCADCGHWWYPPSRICPNCLSRDVEWKLASGLGTVWSRSRFHHLYYKAFEKDLPYNIAMVQLDEGPMFISSVQVPWEQLEIGMRVKVVFEDVTDEVALVRFAPAEARDG